MVLNKGSKMDVLQRSDAILKAVFGEKIEEGLEDSFSVFNSTGNNSGKIYLPTSVSLQPLVDANLPFYWEPDVRETKVVIHY